MTHRRMKKKGKLRRELRRVEDHGLPPSDWLIKRAMQDESIAQRVFPNLFPAPQLSFNFSSYNNLQTIYFNKKAVEQFKKQSAFYNYYTGRTP